MNSTEYLDIFDDNMKHLGTASRDEVHAKGHWHQTFHCWIARQGEGAQYVLFQRRGPDKKLYPNTLDITAAGHLLAGETPSDGIRELTEELGIGATIRDLVPLGIRVDVAIIGSITNREFCHTYLLRSDNALSGYNLQPDEVTGLVQMDVTDGLQLFSGGQNNVRVTGFQVDSMGSRDYVDLRVGTKDIIPRLDRYYLKVFIMAQRYFAGDKRLGI